MFLCLLESGQLFVKAYIVTLLAFSKVDELGLREAGECLGCSFVLVRKVDVLHVTLSRVDLLIRWRIVAGKPAVIVSGLRGTLAVLEVFNIDLFVELVFVDTDWRNDFLVVEAINLRPLGLALEAGDSTAFVEVFLDEL